MLSRIQRIIGLVGVIGVVGFAEATPIQYTFSTGTQISSSGAAAGLLGPAETVTGSFTYNPDGALVGMGIFGTSSGATYQAVNNLYGSVGGRDFYDEVAGADVADEMPPSGQDVYSIISTHVGGAWSTFNIGALQMNGARFFWLENAGAGRPDFLSSDALLPTLPNFLGQLTLYFGPDDTAITGQVIFGNVSVRQVAVPEPTTLGLLAIGIVILGLAALERRHKVTLA